MTDECQRAKRVFTPPADATSIWLWQLAKAHVCSNDAGVHQLINHWYACFLTVENSTAACFVRSESMR